MVNIRRINSLSLRVIKKGYPFCWTVRLFLNDLPASLLKQIHQKTFNYNFAIFFDKGGVFKKWLWMQRLALKCGALSLRLNGSARLSLLLFPSLDVPIVQTCHGDLGDRHLVPQIILDQNKSTEYHDKTRTWTHQVILNNISTFCSYKYVPTQPSVLLIYRSQIGG